MNERKTLASFALLARIHERKIVFDQIKDKLLDAMLKASSNPEVEVRFVAETKEQADIAMKFLISRQISLFDMMIDKEKTINALDRENKQDSYEATTELINGSCLKIIWPQESKQ